MSRQFLNGPRWRTSHRRCEQTERVAQDTDPSLTFARRSILPGDHAPAAQMACLAKCLRQTSGERHITRPVALGSRDMPPLWFFVRNVLAWSNFVGTAYETQ